MKLLSRITNQAIDPKVGDVINGEDIGTLALFISNGVKLIFVIGGLAFFFMLLWGAFEYITAGGEKEKVGSATKRMTNALIGMVILLSSYVIFKLVNTIFGINVLNLEIPTIKIYAN